MNKEEAENKATELIQLAIQEKELKSKIKTLKADLLDYLALENKNEHIWNADNGYVELVTETKYKLADVPADIKVSPDVAAIDVAEKAFKSKVVLSKEGKRMFRDQYPAIVALMIPKIKKKLKLHI